MSEKDSKIRNMLSLLEALFYKIKHENSQLMKDMNLADGQIFLLVMLFKKDECKATDIARHIGITSGAVTGMTDKLESLGLIRRVRSEEDRRVVLLSLTDEGRAVVQRIRNDRYELLKTMFYELDDKDLEDFTCVLTKLTSGLDAKEK